MFFKTKIAAVEALNSNNLDIVIDFKSLNAIAIERNFNTDGCQVTIISYLDKDGMIDEFYCFCSKEYHQKLCRLFREYLEEKYSSESR